MITLKVQHFILVALLVTLNVSCVSTKQYQELEARETFLKQENRNLKKAKESEAEMKRSLDSKSQELDATKDLLKSLSAKYAGIVSNYEDLQMDYDKLSSQKLSLLSATSDEKLELEKQLELKQNELDEKERQLQKREVDIDRQKANLTALQSEISVREQQIMALTESLNQQKAKLDDVKNRISTALSNLSAQDLQIEQKSDGKVYVSLSQELLFTKGSNKIDEKGRTALVQLAAVLAANPEISILVEGHADSDGTAAKNWDLSVTRATEVIKILQDSGVDPIRLTASGKSFYAPIVANDTEVNKARNRRTEIILSPKLDKIYELIK